MQKVLRKAISISLFFVLCLNAPRYLVRHSALNPLQDVLNQARQYAQQLVAGQSVSIRNDVLLKHGQLLAAAEIEVANNPSTVVLGSSHSQMISSAMLNDENTLNLSVISATFQDVAALYAMLREHKITPKRIFLIGDAWSIYEWNAPMLQNRWEQLLVAYQSAIADFGLPVSPAFWVRVNLYDAYIKPFQQLLELPFTILNPSDNRSFAFDDMLNPDGSLQCSEACRTVSTRQVAEIAARGRTNIAQEHGGWKPNSVDYFGRASYERLVRQMQKDGAEVIILITPYHPLLYPFAEHELQLTATRDFYRDLADQIGATVIGSFDPSDCGLSQDDFLDGHHLRPQALQFLLKDAPCAFSHSSR